jgi:hypothetical protein
MRKAAEMGSGAMIYIPCFIKIGSDIYSWRGAGGEGNHRERQHGGLKAYFYFFYKIRKVG